jgi:chloramphenicol-sensitive protein RarD
MQKSVYTGLATAITAYFIWGLSPIYWKSLAAVPAFEILMHRMIWSFVFLFPLIFFTGRQAALKAAVKSPKVMLILLSTTLLVGFNWFLFIWAINSNHILQTSLGYYITPLVSVFLGMVFLKERLRRIQIAALMLAASAVGMMTIKYGQFPWVSLSLAFSFGLYGLIRKIAPVGALVGLTIETMVLSIPAVGYLGYINMLGEGSFMQAGTGTDLLLMGAALMTALPLLLFTVGARLLHLSTIGFLQYVAPSCTFLLAILVYNEPLARPQLVAFIMIWTALILYSLDAVIHYRKNMIPRSLR